MSRLPSKTQSAVWAVAGIGSATASGFAANLLIPSLFSLTVTATYFGLMTFVILIATATRLGIDRGVVKLLSEAIAVDNYGDLLQVRGWLVRACLGMALASALISGVVLHFAYGNWVSTPQILAWTCVWALSEATRLCLSEFLRAIGHLKLATLLGDAGRNVIFLGFVILLATTDTYSHWPALLIAAALASTVMAVGSLVVVAGLRLSGPEGGEVQLTSRLLETSFPFFAVSVCAYSLTQGDIFLGSRLLDADAFGPYAAVAKLAIIVTLPTMALNLAIAPHIAHERNGGSLERYLRRSVLWCSAFSLTPFLLCTVFADRTMATIWPDAYASAQLPLAILATGGFLGVLAGPNTFVLLMLGDARFAYISSLVVVGLQVPLLIAVAMAFGATGLATGAAVTTLSLKLVHSARLSMGHSLRIDALSVLRFHGREGSPAC